MTSFSRLRRLAHEEALTDRAFARLLQLSSEDFERFLEDLEAKSDSHNQNLRTLLAKKAPWEKVRALTLRDKQTLRQMLADACEWQNHTNANHREAAETSLRYENTLAKIVPLGPLERKKAPR